MPKEIREADKALYERFLRLWQTDDPQGRSIFNFLVSAKEQASPGTILLDLGAGQSRYKFFFEHCHYLAADFGKGDAQWDYGQVDLLGDVCRLDFVRDDSVESCLNTVTLEHLSEPGLFFEGVKRILKPAGRLFLYAPFVFPEHQVPYDFFRFTSFGLRHLCDKVGLKVTSLIPSNGALFTGMTWAHQTLSGVECDDPVVKLNVDNVRQLLETQVMPLIQALDEFGSNDNFPICWLLTAQKEGDARPCGRPMNKREVIESVICCPKDKGQLRLSESAYTCSECEREYSYSEGRISFIDGGM